MPLIEPSYAPGRSRCREPTFDHAADLSFVAIAARRALVRAFALSLPGASEDFPWGESVAKVNRKVFVFLGTDASERMSVKLDESHGHALSVEGAEKTGYGLGRAGWVTVPLAADGVAVDVLRDWVEESYRIVAPKRLVAELDRGSE